MKALLTNYHQSPRKVRLVANLIRGKSIEQAQASLLFLEKKSSPIMKKLLDSAVANARNAGVSTEGLVIKSISVDKGAVMRRMRPFSRGRSGTIRKTMSIIKVELGSAPQNSPAKTVPPLSTKTSATRKKK